MATKNQHRLPALLGLCLAAALATACASDSPTGRRTAMGASGASPTGEAAGYTTLVPSPTGASGPMDHPLNATGGTAFGTEGGSGGPGN